jgi:hypothetical protein
MSLVSVAGYSVTRGRVTFGAWGLWFAGVDLAEDAEISGAVTLTVAGTECVCAVLSGGTADGRAAYTLVGGAGGWGQTLDAKAYADDSGVKVRSVLQDAADKCGEQIAGIPSTRQGPHYVRREAPAYETLCGLAPQNWYVDLGGVTQIGQRAEVEYTGTAERTRRDPQAGVVELATESVAQLLPGVNVDGLGPATDVEWLLTSSRLTARVYYKAALSRRLAAYDKIMRALDPWRAYRAAYEFRVVTQSGERFNLQPVRSSTGMPDLSRVPVRPGVAGMRNNVTPGEQVLVQFVDGDPSRPVITNHAAPDEPGWMPLTIELGGPGALGVARQTDAILAGFLAGTIVGGSARVKAVI